MDKIICVWGDSTAWGAYDDESGGWVERLKKYFWDDNHYAMVYNLGISGDTSRRLLKRFDVEAEARKPDVIIFAIGANDSANIEKRGSFWVPVQEFENNLHELIKKARVYTNDVTFIGLYGGDEKKTCPVPWVKDWLCYTNENIKKYNEVIRSVCEKENVKFVDMSDVILKNTLEDGLHPNSRGHKKIFEKVSKVLQ